MMRDLCIRKFHESKFFLNMIEMHIEKERFIENMKVHRRVSADLLILVTFQAMMMAQLSIPSNSLMMIIY